MIKVISILFVLISISTAEAHIRINQVGYLTDEIKRAILGSNQDLGNQIFSVRNMINGQVVYSGKVESSISGNGPDTPFAFNHVIDFSPIKQIGIYRIELHNGSNSHHFQIGNNIYKNAIDILLYFLRAQRCGNTGPELHGACHLADATNTDLDLTGGWHDAGDFLKFTRQEAYTTYILLLSFEIHKGNYGPFFSDQNGNGIADVLDEAKIGLDFLEKCYPDENTFIHRVGDKKADHSQPMRMPDNDRLAAKNRPALFGFNRDRLAKYAYTMALAANIFADIKGLTSKSEVYLSLAKRAYEKAKSTDSGHIDKLCLAALELYKTTGDETYLTQAKNSNDQLFTSDMGNYFNNINLAHARLAPFYPNAASKLKRSIANFHRASMNNLFGFNVPYVWGSLYVALSSASSGLLYQTISNDHDYEEFPRRIKNYTLGMNPWGVCFISGLGTVYPKKIHNSLAITLKRNGVQQEATIKGAVAEGPISREDWNKNYSRLVPVCEDIYAEFQPTACLYHDHVGDYVTNEPCIYGTAEAILFFSFYLKYLTSTDFDIPNPPHNLGFFR